MKFFHCKKDAKSKTNPKAAEYLNQNLVADTKKKSGCCDANGGNSCCGNEKAKQNCCQATFGDSSEFLTNDGWVFDKGSDCSLGTHYVNGQRGIRCF